MPRRLLAVDLAGNAQPLIDDQRDYWRPRISPDATRVAVEVLQPDLYSQIWIRRFFGLTSQIVALGPLKICCGREHRVRERFCQWSITYAAVRRSNLYALTCPP